MYYKLKPNFALRSWLDRPYMLVSLSSGLAKPVSSVAFQCLSFCNGKTDVDSVCVLPAHKSLLSAFLKQGLIEECSPNDEINQEQKPVSFNNEYVHTAHWSITGKCNYKCKHCYLSAPNAKYGELSHEQCLSIIDQLSDCGIANVNLTGGEPLVRSDFFSLVDALCRKNINIKTIYSNGALINENLLDEFEKRGIKPNFSLSFDGIGWHDWLRGVKGAEKIATDALKLLNKRGFTTDVEMCLHKLNADTLESSINLLAELGVSAIKTNPVGNSGEWINQNGKYDLSWEELFNLYLDYIPKFLKAGSPLTLHLGGFFYCRKGSPKYLIPAQKFNGTENALNCKVCGHAKNVMYICPDGAILPCMSLSGLPIKLEKTYITKVPLREALSSSEYLSWIDTTLKDLFVKNVECNKCKYKLTCGGGCRASAALTNNNYFDCDAMSCAIFKNGYIDKIKEAARI